MKGTGAVLEESSSRVDPEKNPAQCGKVCYNLSCHSAYLYSLTRCSLLTGVWMLQLVPRYRWTATGVRPTHAAFSPSTVVIVLTRNTRQRGLAFKWRPCWQTAAHDCSSTRPVFNLPVCVDLSVHDCILNYITTVFAWVHSVIDGSKYYGLRLIYLILHNFSSDYQEGLAVASIARDDPSTLPGDDPFPRARMHFDRNARLWGSAPSQNFKNSNFPKTFKMVAWK